MLSSLANGLFFKTRGIEQAKEENHYLEIPFTTDPNQGLDPCTKGARGIRSSYRKPTLCENSLEPIMEL